jgi:hypothetical protein
MNPETLLVNAWLKAGSQVSDDIGCPGDAALGSLLTRQLPEQEARRLTAHLASCASCRRTVAQLVSRRAVPTPAPVTLAALLASGEVTEAWRGWVRGLVNTLPAEDDELGVAAPAGYQELSPPRIDARGRLIVELAASQAVPAGTRVLLGLASDGARLDLCEVSVRSGSLHAVVDLSAFQPRSGTLRPGVLAAQPVHAYSDIPAILPILANLHDNALSGPEFWDRFAPVAAHGDGLAAALAHEIIAAESDPTTCAPRLRATSTVADIAPADKTPIGRVQYALNSMEAYAALWKECNGKDLDGAAGLAAQMRAALAPIRDPGAARTAVPSTSTSVAPARREKP